MYFSRINSNIFNLVVVGEAEENGVDRLRQEGGEVVVEAEHVHALGRRRNADTAQKLGGKNSEKRLFN